MFDELKAKDHELAALELKLEMKDQEGNKHKQNVEKMKKYVCVCRICMYAKCYDLSTCLTVQV